jgi:surface antigen
MTKLMRGLIGSMLAAGLVFGAAPAQAGTGYLQCAPFARMFSGINLFGAAASWWDKATGLYKRGSAPAVGSVLVFKAISSMRSGHVAVVSQVVSDRMLRITHANWSIINGRRGQVERDVTVVDASPANDWSQVKVWYAPIKAIGTRAYPTFGFIYKDGEGAAARAG